MTLALEPLQTQTAHKPALKNKTAVAIWRQQQRLSVSTTSPTRQRDDFYKVVRQTPLLVVGQDKLPEDLRNSGYILVAKHEGQQHGGAYKLRGITNKLLNTDRSVTLNVASTGNHAQESEIAARQLGFASVQVECPHDTVQPKLHAMRSRGATVNAVHADLPTALAAARTKGDQPGHLFVHPYDDLDIIAGQGTLALETLAQLRELGLGGAKKTSFFPGGGGGIAAGCAVATKLSDNTVEVRIGQMYGAHGIALALKGQKLDPVKLNRACDGAAVPSPGILPMRIIGDPAMVDDVDVVTEAEIGEAMVVLASVHEVPEPAGALSLAAALKYMRNNPRSTANDTPHVISAVTSGVSVDSVKASEFMLYAVADGRVSPQRAAKVVAQAAHEAAQRKRALDQLAEKRIDRTF